MFDIAVACAGRSQALYAHAGTVRHRGIILHHRGTYATAAQLQGKALVGIAALHDAGSVVVIAHSAVKIDGGCVITCAHLHYAQQVVAVGLSSGIRQELSLAHAHRRCAYECLIHAQSTLCDVLLIAVTLVQHDDRLVVAVILLDGDVVVITYLIDVNHVSGQCWRCC